MPVGTREAARREVMDEIREFWERDLTPEVDEAVVEPRSAVAAD